VVSYFKSLGYKGLIRNGIR